MPLVKICGITCEEDASGAIDAGADALGFNFYPRSVRAVRFPEDLGWIAGLPVCRVAVVVNMERSTLAALEGSGAFDAVQFHGDEPPEACELSSLPWLRAFRGVPQDHEIAAFSSPWALCDAAAKAGEYGGTGRLADWPAVKSLAARHPEKQIFLAGGLTPENVAEAVAAVVPFAVDVAGGVEKSPGRKCRNKMREFVRLAKSG